MKIDILKMDEFKAEFDIYFSKSNISLHLADY